MNDNGLSLNMGGMDDENMSLLMRLFKMMYPTYSDTPGMGNVTPYQIPSAGPASGWADEGYQELMEGQHQYLEKHPMTRQQRYGLETLMLDKGLQGNQLGLQQQRQDLLRHENSQGSSQWWQRGKFPGMGRRM
jgi:hypothetical protein